MTSLGRHISLWKDDERIIALKKARPIFTSLHFDVRILPRQAATLARIMVVTPKRVGSAPYRNLLKRRVRSIFYQEKMYQSVNDWVVFFRPSPSILDYKMLHKILLELFKNYH